MKIQIEDYFGNDVVSLNFNQCLVNANDSTIKVIEEISNVHGYSVADVEEGVIRIQCEDAADDYVTDKKELIQLATKLSTQFL